MANFNTVGGLKWVKGEIDASLQRVRQSLESFVRGQGPEGEGAALGDAVVALNEVRGVLIALQLAGPARLVDEMQQHCEALSRRGPEESGEASEALMLALIQLPDYLEELEEGQTDAPLALLPAINDLRGSRGEGPVNEAELLVPTSVLADTALPSPQVQKALARVAGKIRPHFHRYLLQSFKPETAREGMGNLGRLFHQLQRYIGAGIFHEVFLAAEAVLEAILEGSIALDGGTKALIAHMDRVIKPFAEGPDAWPEEQAQLLLGEFISLIARCDSTAYLANELRKVYGLEARDESGLPVAHARLPRGEALSGLIGEARKELLPVKDALDLYARGGEEDPSRLAELEARLRDLSNTLVVTGEDGLVDSLRHCADTIGAICRGESPVADAQLMGVAEELLALEAALADLGKVVESRADETGRLDRDVLLTTVREAAKELATAEQAIGDLGRTPGDIRPLQEVPDLLGGVSAALRMLGEEGAADLLESLVDHVRVHYLAVSRVPSADELELLAQVVSAVELHLDGLAGGRAYSSDLLGDARRALSELEALEPYPDIAAAAVPQEPVTAETAPPPSVGAAERLGIDPEFLEIFLEEAAEEEQTVRDQFSLWRANASDAEALKTLRRSFHTLKGSGRLVRADRVGELSRAVEALLDKVSKGTLQASPELVASVGDAVALLPELISAEAEGRELEVGDLVQRVDRLAGAEAAPARVVAPEEALPAEGEGAPGVAAEVATATEAAGVAEAAELAALADADQELLDIFRGEAEEHLAALRAFLEAAEGEDVVPGEQVVRALHTLKGSARMSGVDSAGAAAGELEQLFGGYQEQAARAPASALELLARTVDALQLRLERLPGGGDEIAALHEVAAQTRAMLSGEEPEAELPAPIEGPREEVEVVGEAAEPAQAPAEVPPPEEPVAPATVETLAAGSEEDRLEALPEDQELLTLFLEDARELLDKLDERMRELQLAPTAEGPIREQKRLLHTLKGSARLSGLAAIGDLSHAFESLLTAITEGNAQLDDDALELAQRTLDTLAEQVDAVEQRRPVRRANSLTQALSFSLQERLAAGPGEGPDVAVMVPAPPPEEAPAEAAGPPPVGEMPAAGEGPAVPAAAPVVGEPAPQIRVRADVLNRLVDNAGEISIYRSRLSQTNGVLGYRLDELDQTVRRLRDQLRQLEIETEAQIIHRFEREDVDSGAAYREGFDPLELDRFSTIQQLSRSLAETVNDLVSLRDILGDLNREAETLLQQQGRIAHDLQDGLLRTRMAPFAQIVPRLHRVVRQTAQQLGKEATLEVVGPEVELDRSIRERIVAPLEHLLRNAVAHGIEPAAQRVAAGKDPAGLIRLSVKREGNDAVISVSDDGGGVSLAAVRARAVARGLLSEDATPSDEDLTQLIMEPGFSTADAVTQIAGRGVGLDVVNAEIRQLSGALALESRPAEGSRFTIRLPLTLAIIEAMLVEAAGEVYAVPHATMVAAARIPRAELEEINAGKQNAFEYAGDEYRVVYLGAMLQEGAVPELGERSWVPALLARAGDQRVAFHVDNLLGSERLVVKPLGLGLSTIRWLTGGTILPSGRVAMILDLLGIIRSDLLQDYRPPTQAEQEAQAGRRCVMIVDDSLTVRRVTSRMLSRQDMDVITARDGVDALSQLEDRIPDVILLDVEMPRMDGYELTRHIRRSPRLQKIPLIMITSRTGEKHRKYAEELGVDRYLGKPYQEAELLDEISAVLLEAAS